MRIAGWRIEGFGVFRDFEVRGLSPGLTVFLGPNEAGKSTLLGFLRGVLFGFPSRRSRAPQYPPLMGGRHGGRVMLCGPGGETTVERIVSRRGGLRVNGSEATDQDLQTLLGGADENLFCSVFAFSLTEMQSFEWLRAEQIRERIFSAGIAGAGASARQAIDSLEEEAAALYRPRGGSRIRELNERIAEAERRRKQAELDADRYLSLEGELDKWAIRAAELSRNEQELRENLRPAENWLEQWNERERLREELSALEPVDEFPSEPEARLATLTSRLDVARAVTYRLQNEKAAVEQERAKLAAALDDGLAVLWDRAEEFHSRLGRHRHCLKTSAAIPSAPTLLARLMQGVLVALGAGVAFGAGWLTGRGQTYAGFTTLLAGLFAAAFLVYWRAARGAGVTQLEREIAEWEDPVREWLSSLNKGESLIAEFQELRERCRKDREFRAKLAAFDEANRGMQSKLEAGRRVFEAAQEELQVFLREAGAAGEGEFQSRLRAFLKRREIRAWIAAVEQKIPAGAPEEWRSEAARLAAEIVRAQTKRDEAVGEQGSIRRELARIAESAAIPAALAELEWLHSERAQCWREWRVAKLAEELVGRTLREFTHTRQPAVLEEASAAFDRVTSGAYQRILQDDSGLGLAILDNAGFTKRPEELSRGSAEQLYLCLRLALASEFARRAESLPLIMDDVLVNFDPDRARAVALELARFAQNRQILIFTCHPETARLFTEVASGAAVIPMERRRSAAQ